MADSFLDWCKARETAAQIGRASWDRLKILKYLTL
jgi:hypothetical protein